MTPHRQRLLFCTTGLGTGGAEMMLAQILARIDSERYRCHVVSLAAGGRYVETLRRAGVEVTDLGMNPGRPSPRALLKLIRVARSFRPHSVIGWMYHGNFAAWLAHRVCANRPRLVWNIRQTLYGLHHEKRGSALTIRLLARLSKQPDAIVYNSRLSASQHHDAKFCAEKAVCVPNGFDTDRFQPDPAARADVRKELGLRPDAILIGRFGRNATMKDHNTFLKAMAELLQRWPMRGRPVYALLVGTDMTSDHRAFESFMATQPKARLDRILFLGERTHLPRLTAALDLAVSSSAFGEGFPNVIGEAMACEIPVVATDIGDSAWVLDDAGVIVPPSDAIALADACEKVLKMPVLTRQAMAASGRRRIVSEFKIDAILTRYQDLFLPEPKDIPTATYQLPVPA